VSYWLKMNGTADHPHAGGDWAGRRASWFNRYGEVSMFPRWPRIAAGDQLIDYAVGSHRAFGEGRIFAVAEVLSDPEPSRHERWPVQVRIRQLIAGPSLGFCPTIADIGVSRRSLGRHSHIRLTSEQGQRVEELIAEAAEQFGSLA
jgi:hypothetical protein